MGKLFDKYARLHDGLIYERDAYGRRLGVDPELISHGLEPVTEVERYGMGLVSDVDVDLLFHKHVYGHACFFPWTARCLGYLWRTPG